MQRMLIARERIEAGHSTAGMVADEFACCCNKGHATRRTRRYANYDIQATVNVVVASVWPPITSSSV